MYSYFNGIVKNLGIDNIILEVANIGYNIYMPEDDIATLNLEENIKIYTQFIHREDDMRLYGFLTNSKLEFFKKLTSVSGVGCKVGLSIISNISEADMCTAIITENIKILKEVPGIGPKMAAKIIFELKDKIKTEDVVINSDKTESKKNQKENKNLKEAVLALQVLGYNTKELTNLIKEENFDELSVEDIIKKCLKILQK